MKEKMDESILEYVAKMRDVLTEIRNILNKQLTESEELVENLEKGLKEYEEYRKKVFELTKEKKRFYRKIKNLEKDKRSLEGEVSKLREENDKLNKELSMISEQLKRISSLYQEVSKEKEDVSNMRDLLSIYVTLLENVFYGRPHARVLWLLHGAKTTMKRSEIVEASAFQPAVIRKAIFDLANAGLVDYDQMRDVVSLKKKLF
ncbi:MAG: hypothetical protein J7L50_00230 [Candidatus Odinarchaeota archaeon]|nr:hypothetical protein [Candidatus Odinarchaeota archaeon]